MHSTNRAYSVFAQHQLPMLVMEVLAKMRLLHLTMLNFLLMITLVVGTVLYGRIADTPGELQQLGFGVCSGKPCFMSLTPGMPWADARTILLKGRWLTYMDDSVMILRMHNTDVAIHSDDTHTQLDKIYFFVNSTDDPEVPLSAVVALFGSPCSVSVSSTDGQITAISLNYPDARFGAWGLSATADMIGVILSKDSEPSSCTITNVGDSRVNPWRGFRGTAYSIGDKSP